MPCGAGRSQFRELIEQRFTIKRLTTSVPSARLFDQFHPMRPPSCDCFSKFALFRKRTPNLIPTHLVAHRSSPLVEPVYASHRDDVGLAPGDRDAEKSCGAWSGAWS